MIVFRPRTPEGYSSSNQITVITHPNNEAIVSGVNALAHGQIVIVPGGFTLVRFLTALERTQIPLRLENEFGLVLEERWPSLQPLISFIEAAGQNKMERYSQVLNMPYVSANHIDALRKIYDPEPEEIKRDIIYDGFRIKGPTPVTSDANLDITGRMVNEILKEKSL